MLSESRKDASFMNGVTELLILQLLARREMYGYELVSAIRESTGDVISVSEGGVYPMLHTMEHRGLLRSRRQKKDGRERLYYRLTESGKGRMEQATDQWVKVSTAINALLNAAAGEGRHAKPV